MFGSGGFQKGHRAQVSSFGAGYHSILPPLSVPDTLVLHGRFAQQGFLDAFKVGVVLDKLAMDKVVQANVMKSIILQGVLFVSAVAIKPLLRRVLRYEARGTTNIAYTLFHILWLYPLAIAATYYAGLLRPSQETDRRVGAGVKAYNNRGMTATVVAESYKVLVLLNYLLVVYLLRWIPYVGGLFAFLYACLIDSYYCFETHWIKQGWPLSERVKFLDHRWGYFFGFGLPLTMISWWSSEPMVNLSLFSLGYPFWAIMSQTALPQPLDPTIPTAALTISSLPQSGQTSFSMAAAEGGEEARGRKGNPFVPISIPVLILADQIYSILVKGFLPKKKEARGPVRNSAPSAYDPNPSSYGAPAYAPSASAYGASAYGASAYGASAYGKEDDTGGSWRGDYGAPPTVMSSRQFGFGHGGKTATPPRRGHGATESSVGVGPTQPAYSQAGEYSDRRLDSLIGVASSRRKKGE